MLIFEVCQFRPSSGCATAAVGTTNAEITPALLPKNGWLAAER